MNTPKIADSPALVATDRPVSVAAMLRLGEPNIRALVSTRDGVRELFIVDTAAVPVSGDAVLRLDTTPAVLTPYDDDGPIVGPVVLSVTRFY